MGSFSKCTLSSKVLTLNVLLVGLFLLSFWVFLFSSFSLFVSFLFSCSCFFSRFLGIFILFRVLSWPVSWLSSCSGQSHGRGSVCWLMLDINLHPLLGTDKVSGDFMLSCNCSWLMFLLKVLEHVYDCCFIERAPQFVCGLVFSFLYGWVSSFPCLLTDWLLLCCQSWNVCNLVIGSSFNSSQVDWNPKFLEILSTHEYIVSLICLWP